MKIHTVNQDKIRNIENELFNTEYFNEESTVFPNKVFKKKFGKYYFLDTEDWFSSEPEFKKIIEFVKENGEQEFYNTIPGFNNIAGIEIPVQIDYKSYVLEQTFENKDNSIHGGIGLRMSPEMFYFDTSKKWAIVFDLTKPVVHLGIKKEKRLSI